MPRKSIFDMPFSAVYAALINKAEKKVRQLDKLVDELAKGKTMEKVKR